MQSVAKETLARAMQSQAQTETLMTFALVLSGMVFLGILGMAFYTHRQVAVPLREVSSMLSGISSRKDLTYRLKQHNDDEVGDIVLAVNNLLAEFQRLASTLDGTAQEVNRTVNNITQVTEETRTSMTDSNANLRNATHDFMKDIQKSNEVKDITKEIDMNLHRAQMKFIQTHIVEIDEGTKITDRHVRGLQASISKLQKLADHLHVQIRTLNF